jgi:hypothetical protein
MLKKLDQGNRHNWVTDLKSILFRYGFGIAWFAQELGDINAFVSEFKLRLQDCSIQEWHASVNSTPKLAFYSEIKSMLDVERYLICVPELHLRRAMSCLRCSSHTLAIEKGRHENIPRADRICLYCQATGLHVIEDEYHLFKCSLYSDIRQQYLPNIVNFDSFTLIRLMNSEQGARNVSKYIYHSFRRQSSNVLFQ